MAGRKRNAGSKVAQRSSLRVATAHSLDLDLAGSASCDGTTGTGRRASALGHGHSTSPVPMPPSPTAGNLPERDNTVSDLSTVPRLDRPWVMYDMAGRPFMINPVESGRHYWSWPRRWAYSQGLSRRLSCEHHSCTDSCTKISWSYDHRDWKYGQLFYYLLRYRRS